jgi:hypothetical protein
MTGILGVAMLVLVWSVQPATGEDAPVTLEKLHQGLQQREAALKSFSVKAEVKGQLSTGDKSTTSAKEFWTIDTDLKSETRPGCRVRKERLVRRTTPDGKTGESLEVAVYDGVEMRALSGSPNGKWNGGRSSDQWHYAFDGHGAHPRTFLTHHDFEPWSRYIAKNPTKILGNADWKGRSVLRVEVGPFPWKSPKGWSAKVQLLTDPKRGFALVRQAISVQCGPGEEWHEYGVYELEDLAEAARGIWLPTRASYEWGGAGRKPKMMSRHEFRFSDWNLKPDVSDSVFRLDFRPGLIVTDERAPNGGYIVR